MSHILRFLQVFALGTWTGAILYFALVVTQGAFAVLPSREEAGALVGFTLSGLHTLGIVAGVVFLAAAVALSRSAKGLARPAALGVVLMLLLTLASQRLVLPRMDALRMRMGAAGAAAAENAPRSEFDRLHSVSVGIEGAVLLLGLVSLFGATRDLRGDGPAR